MAMRQFCATTALSVVQCVLLAGRVPGAWSVDPLDRASFRQQGDRLEDYVNSPAHPENHRDGSRRKPKALIVERQPRRVGLAQETLLPSGASSAASAAIVLARTRGIPWSTSDDTLHRVLAYMKQEWGHSW